MCDLSDASGMGVQRRRLKGKGCCLARESFREWDLSDVAGSGLKGKAQERKNLLFGKEKALRKVDLSALGKRTLIKLPTEGEVVIWATVFVELMEQDF